MQVGDKLVLMHFAWPVTAARAWAHGLALELSHVWWWLCSLSTDVTVHFASCKYMHSK